MSFESCPDDNGITLMLQGGLGQQETERIQAHLDQCEACAELFSALFSLIPEKPRHITTPRERSAVSSVGRYIISTLLGAGAMGAVFEAWDPELERKVAIKLLRPDRFGDRQTYQHATERLLREARALAALDHSNLLTVYDVGVYREDSVFIASAYIDGVTVDVWSRGKTWQEIVACYEQVCRGLAHAHARGIIHRDIKPQNILVDASNRARVCDFGLATSDLRAPDHSSSRRASFASLTQTGAIVGTPAYMAPEQLDGQPVGAPADQHAVCACLYEALYGFRPFSGETLAELARSVRSGELVAPKSSRIPRALFDVLARGLSPRAEERHEDMRQLEAALQRVREADTSVSRSSSSPWRARIIALVLLFLMAVGVGAILPELMTPRARAPASKESAKRISKDKDKSRDEKGLEPDTIARAALEPKREDARSPEAKPSKAPPTDAVTRREARETGAAGAPSNAPPRGSWQALRSACTKGDRACGECVASAKALGESGALRAGVAYTDEAPMLAIAARCAYEQKDCSLTSALFLATREPAAHINSSAREDAHRSTARMLGWSFPECPLVYETDPILRAYQVAGVLSRAYEERSAPRCERAWGMVEAEVASWKPGLFDRDARGWLFTSLGATSACLAASNCELARRVWRSKARVQTAPVPDADIGEAFAKIAPRCVLATDREDARVEMFEELVDRARGERDPADACAQLWSARRDSISSLAKSLTDPALTHTLDNALIALARCVAPRDCSPAFESAALVKGSRARRQREALSFAAYIAPSCVPDPPDAKTAASKAAGMIATASPPAEVRAVLEPWIERQLDRRTRIEMASVLDSIMALEFKAKRCEEARLAFSLAQRLNAATYTEPLWAQWAKSKGCSP